MIRGTNFGNWLVLEKWMAPELFDGTDAEDEVWLNRLSEPEVLARQMKAHRDTYITEEDFKWVADHGMNLVRLPVPFFVFGDRPPYLGCIEYVDKAMDWSEKYSLQLLIDLHTVPGSQNGYDNGGITGVCKWCQNPEEVEFSLTVLERLAQRYGHRKGLFGIEVLNEPISWMVWVTAPSTGKARDKEEAKGSAYVPMKFLKQYYMDAYQRIRVWLPEDKTIVFHDGFRLGSWKDYFVRSGMKNVMLDTHIYIFAMEGFLPVPAYWIYMLYVKYNCHVLKKAASYTPVVVGEWNIENHRAGRKAKKHAGTQEKKDALMKQEYWRVARMELDAWETSAGWIYWSYQLHKTHDGPMMTSDKGDSMEAWDLVRTWNHGWWPTQE